MSGTAARETAQERARRLGLTGDDGPSETVDQRAQRLGLAPARGNEQLHAEFKSGRLAKRMARENANDREQLDSEPSYGERLATHLLNTAQGIPGVEAVEAAGGSLGSRFTKRPMSYTQSLNTLRDNTAQIGRGTSFVEKLAGSLATTPFLPKGPIAGGAAYGAADRALEADPVSLKQRAVDTGIGTAEGVAAGTFVKGVGRGATRIGLTDRIANLPAPVTSNLQVHGVAPRGPLLGDAAAAIGTQGAMNDLLHDRQQILDRLPATQRTAAETMANHVDAYKAEADRLYTIAKNDKGVIADPRVQQALQDPDVRQAFELVQARTQQSTQSVNVQAQSPLARPMLQGHAGSGAPQITVTPGSPATPALPPAVQARMGAGSPNRLLPALASPPQISFTVELPHPELLANTKRMLRDVVARKFDAGGLSPVEAARLAPKIDELNAALHDASPAWKDADAHYANAKNFESAFRLAYDAKQGAGGQASEPRKLKTQESISRWAAKGKGQIGAERARGQQMGTAQRLAEEIRNAPLGPTQKEFVKGAGVASRTTETAARYREPAFDSPDDAQAFADALGQVRAKGETASRGIGIRTPIGEFGLPKPKPPLATAAGERLRARTAQRLADPKEALKVKAEVAAAERGKPLVRTFGTRAGVAGTRAAGAATDRLTNNDRRRALNDDETDWRTQIDQMKRERQP